jgi:hypothetical protein
MQPAVLSSLLLALPDSIEELEIASPCTTPAVASLGHFTSLRCLRVTGNAAAVDWRLMPRSPPQLLPALSQLSLDYRQEPLWNSIGCAPSVVKAVPERALSGLQAASHLSTLTLRCQWDDRAQTLLQRLPALAEVR